MSFVARCSILLEAADSCHSINVFSFLVSFSVNPKHGHGGKSQQDQQFQKYSNPFGSNNNTAFTVTYITFLPHSDMQFELQWAIMAISTCTKLLPCDLLAVEQVSYLPVLTCIFILSPHHTTCRNVVMSGCVKLLCNLVQIIQITGLACYTS